MARPPKVSDDEILDVARRCFLESGPGVATSAIASELDVSEAAIFKRFGTKEELMVRACMPPAVPGFVEHLQRGPDPDRPIDVQIAELAHEILGFLQILMPRLAVLKAAGVSPFKVVEKFDVPPPVLGQRMIRAWLERGVAQGQLAPHDSDSVAFLFMGALHGRTALSLIAPGQLSDFDPQAYVDEVVRVLMAGLAPRADG